MRSSVATERLAALRREILEVLQQLGGPGASGGEEEMARLLQQVGGIEKHTRALVAALEQEDPAAAAGRETACELFAYPASCTDARDAAELPLLLLTNTSVETEAADEKALEEHMHEHAGKGLNEQFVALNKHFMEHNSLVEAALESVAAAQAAYSKRNDAIRQRRMAVAAAAPGGAAGLAAGGGGAAKAADAVRRGPPPFSASGSPSPTDAEREAIREHMMRLNP